MSTTKPIIEIHYFSGGLKTILLGLGTSNRPDWLPDYDLVGLHNDIFPKNNEFIIELSRHKRKDNLISWVGVYTKGNDAVYGDRSNYIGLGIWLINSFPFKADLIIDGLVKICQKLEAYGEPTNDVLSECNRFLENRDYLQSWTRGLEILPRLNNGVIFDTTLHPNTIYIQTSNEDREASIKKISDSMLMNYIKADNSIKNTSRILYLILSPTSKIENIKQIYNIDFYHYSIGTILEYLSSFIKDTNDINIKLEDQCKKISAEYSKCLIEAEELNKNLDDLKILNQEVNSKYDQLKKSQKSPGQLLQELKHSVDNNSTINNADKNNLLMLVDAIDKNRYINFDNNPGDDSTISIAHYNNFTTKLNDISKNINYLKANLDDIRLSKNLYNNKYNQLFGISNNIIIYIALSTILLCEIVFLVLYFFNE